MLEAGLTGFGSGFGLILAIGAQNAFVLRQGLLREHVFVVCLICAVSDALLISAGVFGFGALAELAPWLPEAMRWGGALFLFGYALRSFWSARSEHALVAADEGASSVRVAILTCLAFTWLNPHVYLDTVALLGAISSPFLGADKVAFAAGAIAASFTFFFGLGFGARLLAPVFAKPRAWRWLDVGIGLVMLWLAVALVTG